MKPDDVLLDAVNWEHGMLLTPEHFLRQERYLDAALLWMLRYATTAFGLVGGGARLGESERGAVRHDPIVQVTEDDKELKISVSQCRGITPSGGIVEVTPDNPVHREFLKADLEGVTDANVYIVARPHEKEAAEGPVDAFNPQMLPSRRPRYRVALQVYADTAPYSLSVARIVRTKSGAGYEKDSAYIPPCATMVAHSEMAAAWRRITEEILSLSERYVELNRAMQEFLVLFRERGIDVDLDRETLVFVGRMVVALQNCVYQVADPVQAPGVFFGHLRRLFHSAAVYFDLNPSVQQYFTTLRDTGETEFVPVVERQKQILAITPKWEVHDDLGIEVRSTLHALAGWRRLETALEGKYMDFRVSPSLEAMNFIFDRGGKVLYKLAAKPSRMQGFADELSIHFAGLRLEGKEKYRLILTGEANAVFDPNVAIKAEVRINEGSGYRRAPAIVGSSAKLPNQRNFEFDFEAPDVPTITDLRVSIPAHFPIRNAVLFTRHRFYAEEPQRGAATPVRPAADTPYAAPSAAAAPVAGREPVRPNPWDREPSPEPPPAGRPDPARHADPRPADPHPAPWETPRREQPGGHPDEPQPPNQPPRRRRLG